MIKRGESGRSEACEEVGVADYLSDSAEFNSSSFCESEEKVMLIDGTEFLLLFLSSYWS